MPFRYLLLALLLLHGLIHLLGFLDGMKLVRLEQFTGRTLIPLSTQGQKAAAVLWLIACLGFLFTALLLLLQKEEWWIWGLAAVLLSQALIILYWADARYGTIPNVLALIGIVIAFGAWRFERTVEQTLRAHIPPAHPAEIRITEAMLEPLPPVVRNWLTAAGVVGKPEIRTLRIRQTGKMRTEPNGAWMTTTAEQYFSSDPPAFIWDARVMAGPIPLYGLDRYLDGRGHMLIKLLALFPVANASGETIDQGTMLRFLAEIVWFPSAALNEYIEWEQVDERTARATMRYGGISAEGLFRFNAQGLPESFEARRYYDRKEGATLETWIIRNLPDGYKTFNGITIPTQSEVTWKLPFGDFTWFTLEIVEWEGNAVLKH